MFANDKTSIITYASSALGVCPLTKDKELLYKNAKFYSSGGTNANDAVGMALRQFVGVSGNKSIILLSDGDVNVSDSNIEKAQKNDINIHAIALGEGANSNALKKCAEKTLGEFFIVKTSAELDSIYDRLSANNQLNFDYLSDTDGDGVPDDIEISGVPMPSGKLVFLDPTNPDTDGDGLSDGEEVGKLYRVSPSDVPDQGALFKFSFDVTSDPTLVDSDEDGFEDSTDISPLKAICFVDFDHYKQFKYGEKTTFTIFVDQPYVGSREVINPNDLNEFVGHTYVGIDSGKNYKEYAGFWQLNDYGVSEAVTRKTVYGCIRRQGRAFFTYGTNSEEIDPFKTNGNVYFESNHKWDIVYVCTKDNLELGVLNEYASNYILPYNMMSNNCTTFAADVMEYLGIKPVVYIHPWQSSEKWYYSLALYLFMFSGYSPADAGEDIRSYCPLYIYMGKEIDGRGNENIGVMEGRN